MNSDTTPFTTKRSSNLDSEIITTNQEGGAFKTNDRALQTFKELGNDLNRKYKNEQKSLNASPQDLPGKEELKKLVSPNNNLERTLKIDEQTGRNCGKDNQTEIFCGFLKLHSKQERFAIKITYDKNKGRVTVVKRTGENLSYYNEQQKRGVNKAVTSTFEQLESWNQDKRKNGISGGEEEFNQPSIVKNN